MPSALLVTNIGQLLTLRGPAPRRGRALLDTGIIAGGAILLRDDRIAAVGARRQIERLAAARRARKLDVGGRVVVPGLVDSHTHLVFAACRVDEYERRLAGASYEEIARAGGGIASSVRRLRAASPAALERDARARLAQFAAHGTTTLEAKSGYGANEHQELKILQVQRALQREQPLEIVSTFLGAHAVPAEFRRRPQAYVELVVRRMIPAVARRGLAEFCDVFCDRGAFGVEQARAILTAGRACGLEPRLHAEQLAHTGAARLAVAIHAASADHLDQATRADVALLANSDVVCTMLPGASLHLGVKYPPGRALIDAGAIVALATDFNPGTSPTLSLPMAMSLACSGMRWQPAEALAAATVNAAYSLRRHHRIGTLEVGKQGDLAVFDVADYREIPYYFGVNLCWLTIKRGEIAYAREPGVG
ncbi:MAG TPA: imidazolonepropionase [Candidatus Acidoferrales bacterium]|nr:imidazolonepropionase [Candidatus Acidoferrales bacterium]